MNNLNPKYIRLAALFVFGWFLFSYPLLALFNLPRTIGSIPLLFAYLYILWAVLIVLAWIITRFSRADQAPNSRERTAK